MSLVLAILGWILFGLLALVLGLLLIPFQLEARGIIDEQPAGRARLRWGGGLLTLQADSVRGIGLYLLGLRVWRPGRRRSASKPKAPKKKRTVRRWRAGLTALRHRRVYLRLARTVWRATPVRGSVTGTIGLSDPAHTALLFAVLDRLIERNRALDLAPDWLDATFRIEGRIRIHLWPARMVAALLWLILRDGQVRRGLWAMIQRRGATS